MYKQTEEILSGSLTGYDDPIISVTVSQKCTMDEEGLRRKIKINIIFIWTFFSQKNVESENNFKL